MALRRAALIGLLGCATFRIGVTQRGANAADHAWSEVTVIDSLAKFGPGSCTRLPGAPRIGSRHLSSPIYHRLLEWRFQMRSMDNHLVPQFGSDTTPPATTSTLTGSTGRNGWYRGPVEVTLNASDRDGAVARTSYTLDGSVMRPYSAPFTISQNGIHHVTYFSTDLAGNDELVKGLDVKVDSVPPSVTLSAAPSSLWPPNNQIVTVTVRGMLADVVPGSGLDRSSARFGVMDSYGQVQPSGTIAVGSGGSYTVTVLLLSWRNEDDRSGRTYTIIVSASDLAGNVGAGSTSVRVPHDQRNAARGVPLMSSAPSTAIGS